MLEDDFQIDDVNEESEQSELYEHHRLVIEPGQKMLRLDKYLVSRLGA